MTRFGAWPPWAARLALALLAALIAYGATIHAPLLASPKVTYQDGDLYAAVAARVAHGEDYYSAAAAEHRAHGYPTAPPQVFREPALGWMMAALRAEVWRKAAFYGLALAVGAATILALERGGMPFPYLLAAMPVMATGIGVVIIRGMLFMHEAWAGLLIALSLALYSPRRWLAPVAIGLCACLIRELAVGYLVAMAAAALWERRWREACGWGAAMAVFAGLFSLHLRAAAGLHLPGDAVSPGWLGLGGAPFILQMARSNVGLLLAPTAIIAAAVGVALVGLAGARNPVATRAGLIVGGYMAGFLVLGRPDNTYWGLLYTPILPLGVVLAPPALRDLWRRAVPRGTRTA
ncbi:hypothetical protein [Phenylobacterium sp.]|uniref:hypothetical protein n=1 Tax=Phenylobacterium sp. TaxID=1871053 RepID=UPI0012061731|nr:hypothetical protein [Phenylobacterium sp.]THD58091.1 MAG: hypothetical protein E8A49_20710 [Phenylobacterium sp.]